MNFTLFNMDRKKKFNSHTLYCPYCGEEVLSSDTFCRSCRRTLSDPPVERNQESSSVHSDNNSYRSPKISAFFSLIGLGLGQFYNGDTKKGLVIIIGFSFITYFLLTYTTLNPVVFIFSIWALAIFDAYTSAEKINSFQKSFNGKSIFFWLECVFLIAIVVILFLPMGSNLKSGISFDWIQSHTKTAPRTHINFTQDELETGQVIKEPSYILRGKNGHIQFTMYRGVYDYLAINNPNETFGTDEYYLTLINSESDIHKKYLAGFLRQIQKKTDNRDDQARIAISLVQQIYYERDKSLVEDLRYNFPYETLYKDGGTCADKSILLAYILKELGYGVALLEFSNEHHMVVGVRAPLVYSYKNTGYAFIDPVCNTLIPTYDKGKYGNKNETLTEITSLIQISDGDSFESIGEEYQDAIEWSRILQLADEQDSVLKADDYASWLHLRQKYGMVQTYPRDICE